MKILFSPVGGTDPIALNNFCDGSLLHICRFYKPDIVYMYMSHEILEFQKQDDRYRYCLNKLSELQGRKMEIREIERDELISVQMFDYFYDEFRGILSEIQHDMKENDELLLNISSGTPAMKSSLIVLATLIDVPCKTIQVSTPEKKLNEHSHKGYDVETLWEENPDNKQDSENRCQEVKCPSLSYIKQEELLKRLISEYDYSAAYAACKQLPDHITQSYLKYIDMANKRLQLDYASIGKLVKSENIPGFPIKDDRNRDIFEFALYLDIKVKKGEYADFIRALSPVIFELFIRILKKFGNIDLINYIKSNESGGMYWDRMKLSDTEVLEILEREFNDFRSKGPVYSSHLIVLIREHAAQDDKYLQTAESLRSIEEKARNIAVHQIVAVTDEKIHRLTGFHAADICSLIHKGFTYADINVKAEGWKAYDEMNQFIISRM